MMHVEHGGSSMDAYRVWIEEGCVACGVCAHYCPEVFCLRDESQEAQIRGEARSDGVTNGNAYARAEIITALRDRVAGDIADAVLDCPMQVVRWERVEQEAPAASPEAVLAA